MTIREQVENTMTDIAISILLDKKYKLIEEFNSGVIGFDDYETKMNLITQNLDALSCVL